MYNIKVYSYTIIIYALEPAVLICAIGSVCKTTAET